MMDTQIYDKIFQDLLKTTQEGTSLLLQVCCAPCSTAVLERLLGHFQVTLFFDNPNIYPKEEYERRASEVKSLASTLQRLTFEETPYHPERFNQVVGKYAHLKEGSARCFSCYRLRLEETARVAKERGFDYFGTTLSISPHKNARVLNHLGEKLAKIYGVNFLYSDFKKKGGFKRSLELSERYELYRQDYCGCRYSLEEAKARAAKKTAYEDKSVDKSVDY